MSSAILCMAHPGHELRIFHWLETTKPLCLVLTDGSGADRTSRLDGTTQILRETGARIGPIYGRFPDRKLYELILKRDPAPFLALAEEIVAVILSENAQLIAGDEIEGFNTGHDVCRLMINAAVERCRRRHGRALRNLEFPLDAMRPPVALPDGAVHLELDDAAFTRKSGAARRAFPSIAVELERLVARHGREPFRHEVLLPADPKDGVAWDRDTPPFYETYGARRVAEGHYSETITLEKQMRPLAQALWDWAAG